MSETSTVIASLQEAVAEILRDGTVAVVIGYRREPDADIATPLFVRNPEDAGRLVFDDACFGNLAVYLTKKEVRSLGKIGLVVKGCDLRAVNVLIRENVIEREDVFLIGVCCNGVGSPQLDKCSVCDAHDPKNCDVVVGETVGETQVDRDQKYHDVLDIASRPLEERWEFWQRQWSKCIRCYACRQVCPLCYCKRCVVEKTEPRWVEPSAHVRGNLSWNVVRAFHNIGRCVGCGECERVCPMNIPLNAINLHGAKLVEECYGFRSGLTSNEQAPFTTWSLDDPENGIL